jgi:hypothetical protein
LKQLSSGIRKHAHFRKAVLVEKIPWRRFLLLFSYRICEHFYSAHCFNVVLVVDHQRCRGVLFFRPRVALAAHPVHATAKG